MNISVALCTFNGQAYLARQLRSLAEQRRRPDELVIFDDGSTDQTVEIIRQFAASAPFEVRWQVNAAHLGVSRNFQSAIAAASGTVIACCDQDDVWYPEKLAVIEDAFTRLGADLVFSDADVVDENLAPVAVRLWRTIGFLSGQQSAAEAGRLWSVLVRFNVVTGAAMAFASRWRELLLPIPDAWLHDGWIATALSIVGRCHAVSRPLMAYRCHAGQQIGPGPLRWREQVEQGRRMDHAYFAGLERNFTELMNRLSRWQVEPEISRLLWDKLMHCRRRAAMRMDGSRRRRMIASEALSGRYGSCALGWKSMAQDIWLA
jgi:glycosyltransferase involved in cell wall biosynthesis